MRLRLLYPNQTIFCHGIQKSLASLHRSYRVYSPGKVLELGAPCTLEVPCSCHRMYEYLYGTSLMGRDGSKILSGRRSYSPPQPADSESSDRVHSCLNGALHLGSK